MRAGSDGGGSDGSGSDGGGSDGSGSDEDGSESVDWHRGDPDAAPEPMVRRVPFLELKLEHPALEPTAYGEGFFPDAVPYELDGRARAFYWRPSIDRSSTPAGPWALACATTGELRGVADLPAAAPPLAERGSDETTVIVDGTVGGDATTARVRSYDPPAVGLESISDERVVVAAEGTEYAVDAGDRRRLPLADRTVEVANGDADGDATRTTVTPTLAVRYPGRRELHHPAPGAAARLFPSFGLELSAFPQPMAVPTAAGELDHDALAERLGLALESRPYPERVLWRAFAYGAFDPHAEAVPTLTQVRTGHLVLRRG